MSELTLSVGGRQFSVSCQAGEEEHVLALAERVEEKFEQLAPRYSHNLLFAALQLADELHAAGATPSDEAGLRQEIKTLSAAAEDAQVEIARLRETIAELGGTGENGTSQASDLFRTQSDDAAEEELLPALERFAGLLEDCAAKLDARNG